MGFEARRVTIGDGGVYVKPTEGGGIAPIGLHVHITGADMHLYGTVQEFEELAEALHEALNEATAARLREALAAEASS